MRILVFQHLDIEHPGIFRDFLDADGIVWDVVELDAGERIPRLADYDALWVMGGPMDVWEEEEYPWFVAEKRAIREAVLDRQMPYLGVCLGHQLLGDALGGRVGKAHASEVGIMDVELNPAGQSDALFAGIPATMTCLQWHGAAVLDPPGNAVVLAHSSSCDVQAMRVGRHAWGIQFHVEATAETVPMWSAVPAYKTALEAVLGDGAATALASETVKKLPDFERDARTIYRNFMKLARTR